MGKLASERGRVIHKVVYELRYEHGFTYLDRCGATINGIVKSDPQWNPDPPNPGAVSLRHAETNAVFSFGVRKLDLSQEITVHTGKLMTNNDFAELSESLTGEVVKHLDLESFTRMGFRIWTLFGRSSFQDARKSVKNAGLVRYSDIESLEDVEEVEGVGFNAVVSRKRCSTRIAVAAVKQETGVDAETRRLSKEVPYKHESDERKSILRNKIRAKKLIEALPEYAVLVDMDHSLENPPDAMMPDTIRDFILSGYEWSEKHSQHFIHPPPTNRDKE